MICMVLWINLLLKILFENVEVLEEIYLVNDF